LNRRCLLNYCELSQRHIPRKKILQSFLGNQNDMAEGKTTLHEQICCQEMLFGFPEVKTASLEPQIVDLFSHPLGINRNGICNYQRPNKKGKKSI